ncbi:MAG: hypothetical protein NWF04_08610 [Candidatus Bathyarchaeota archaeon]|nr:hypothetical protein [Candidatus Bathyarchaeota archaeon]
MVVLNKKSFRLPRMEKEKFVLLLRLGLNYDRGSGTFSVKDYNNIDKAIDAISEILNDKHVGFKQNCLICGKDFPCIECKYYEICNTRNLPFTCVCGNCLEEGKIRQEKQQLLL